MRSLKGFLRSIHIRKMFRYFAVFFIMPFVLITALILNNLFASFSQQTMQDQLVRTEQAMDYMQGWVVTFDRIIAQLVGDNELNRNHLHLYSEQSALQHRLRLMAAAHTGLENIWYELPDDMGFLAGSDSLSIERLNYHRYYTDENRDDLIYNRLHNGEILALYDRYDVQQCLLYPVLINTRGVEKQTLIVFEVNLSVITSELQTLYGAFPGRVRLRTADGRVLTETAQGYEGGFDAALECPHNMMEDYSTWAEFRGGILQREHFILTSVASQQWAIDLICLNNLVGSFQVMQSVALMLMAVFVLGCCVCLALAVRLYKPIRSLRDSLSSVTILADGESVDDYDYIESSIELIRSDNQQLRRLLNEHTEKAQEFVASRLFSGRIHSYKEFYRTYAFCGSVPADEPYHILVVDSSVAPLDKVLAKVSHVHFIQSVNQHHTLFCTGTSIPSLGIGVGKSGPSENWAEIPLQCAKAWFACSIGQAHFTEGLCQQTIEFAGENFRTAFENVLNEKALDTLQALRQLLHPEKLHTQTCALAAGILQWMETFHNVLLDDASLFYISQNASHTELRNNFDALLSLMESWLEPEERESGDLLEQMYQYIAKHYDTPDFSIKQMASDFSMSISGLSAYFKNRAGVLLSEYITEMKMKKAMYLLEFSNLSIQEVGFAIGYLNVNSFIRRFQQLNQMSPKEYRLKQCAHK